MPQVNRSATHAIEYLHRRGIDYELIDFCIKTGRLYESYPYHNVVFVGMDADGKPRYANQRGIGPAFICDCRGENLDSLSDEQINRYGKMFRYPEHLARVNGTLFGIPYRPQPEQER